MDAAEVIHEKFVAKVGGGTLPRRQLALAPEAVGLAGETVVELFYSQSMSRQLDRNRASTSAQSTCGSARVTAIQPEGQRYAGRL